MSQIRYLIVLPRRGLQPGGSTLRLAASPADASTEPPALWCSDPGALLWMPDNRGVVIGPMFDRKSFRRVRALADAAAAKNVSSSLDAFVSDYWGAYLAIQIGTNGADFRLLRDPSGMMPCYLVEAEDQYVLASDLGSLEAAGIGASEIAWDRLFEHLQANNIRRTATCIADISELSPGILYDFGEKGRSERVVWTPWAFTGPDPRIGSDMAARELRETICASVEALASNHRHIIVGLSGGLDSSIVCAALAASGQPFTALTMSTTDPSGDERAYARLVAQATGADLREHLYSCERIDLGRSASAHLPRPVSKPFMQEIERVYAEEVEALGGDAIFTGNGGDNIFCYLHSAAPIVDRLRSAAASTGIARTFVDMCRITQCDMLTMARATLSMLAARRPAASGGVDMSLLNSGRGLIEPSRPLTPYLDDAPGRYPGKAAHVSLLVRIQNVVEGYERRSLPPVVPALLAQPIVETCLRIASWDWCRGGINRAVARDAFREDLPAPIVRRISKSGPESLTAVVYDHGKAELREMLLGGVLRDKEIIDAAAIEAALADPATVRGQLLYRLLDLADAEAWARSRMSGKGRVA